MNKGLKVLAGLLAGLLALTFIGTDVYAGTPVARNTIEVVQFGFNPGVIVLPYGASLTKSENGSYVLSFLDGSRKVYSAKSTNIVYSKVVNNEPITVTYNLGTLIATAQTPNTTATYKNGSILQSKVVNYGSFYTVESYNDNGAILKNESYDTATGRLLAVDDYVKTPGMIVRTEYDALGRPVSMLPYYGSTNPAYYDR